MNRFCYWYDASFNEIWKIITTTKNILLYFSSNTFSHFSTSSKSFARTGKLSSFFEWNSPKYDSRNCSMISAYFGENFSAISVYVRDFYQFLHTKFLSIKTSSACKNLDDRWYPVEFFSHWEYDRFPKTFFYTFLCSSDRHEVWLYHQKEPISGE